MRGWKSGREREKKKKERRKSYRKRGVEIACEGGGSIEERRKRRDKNNNNIVIIFIFLSISNFLSDNFFFSEISGCHNFFTYFSFLFLLPLVGRWASATN